jgi:hypothetical protein
MLKRLPFLVQSICDKWDGGKNPPRKAPAYRIISLNVVIYARDLESDCIGNPPLGGFLPPKSVPDTDLRRYFDLEHCSR